MEGIRLVVGIADSSDPAVVGTLAVGAVVGSPDLGPAAVVGSPDPVPDPVPAAVVGTPDPVPAAVEDIPALGAVVGNHYVDLAEGGTAGGVGTDRVVAEVGTVVAVRGIPLVRCWGHKKDCLAEVNLITHLSHLLPLLQLLYYSTMYLYKKLNENTLYIN